MFTALIVITCLAILYFIFPRVVTALVGILGIVALGFMFSMLPTSTLLWIGIPFAVSLAGIYWLVRKGYIESGLD